MTKRSSTPSAPSGERPGSEEPQAYQPRQYSAREQVVFATKLLLITGALVLALWLLNKSL